MPSQRNKLQEDVRFRVLRLLQEDPNRSQRELAEALGISTGSVHYVLSALVEKGFVKLGNFSAAEDKRRYAYLLTPKGVAEKARVTRKFLERKIREFELLRSEIEELQFEVEGCDNTAKAGKRN